MMKKDMKRGKTVVFFKDLPVLGNSALTFCFVTVSIIYVMPVVVVGMIA